MMKNFSGIAVILLLVFAGCGPRKNTEEKLSQIVLMNDEIQLLDSLSIEHEVLQTVRTLTDSSVKTIDPRFYSYNDSLQKSELIVRDFKGFSFQESARKADQIISKLQKPLKKKGYLIYKSESNFGYSPDQVTILKTKDQFDILRFEQTDGINYGIENEQVIVRLQEWNRKYPFYITGADQSWVEAVFLKKPSDMKAFSQELFEFCPDLVHQGTGTVEALEEEMKRGNGLYLWWD